MKKSIKLTTIFASVVTFLVAVILSISLSATPVKAASGSVFEMEAGAGVKLTANGLRFKAKMDQDYYDMIVNNDAVELWGYIAPVEEFDKVEAYKDLGVKVGGKLDESKIYQGDDGYYYANIVITNLDKYTSGGTYLYAKSFSAIAFIVDKSGSGTQYTYAELAKDENGVPDINMQNRTQYEVVNAAMLDANESYEVDIMAKYGDWYGSAEYPIVFNTVEQCEAFNSKVAQGTDFGNAISTKYIAIKQEVALTAAAAAEEATNYIEDVVAFEGHRVTFYDGNSVVKTMIVEDTENATVPANPKRDGYDFVEWVGNTSGITEDTNVYAKWKPAMGSAKDIGNMSVYGVSLANGATITADSDVIGQKVVLASGTLGDGAYYPGETSGTPDPTDENNTADQAYLAYDGSYGFNDYFVADFTGKNMPTLAFFANNYNNSIFYGDGTKNGVVVSTGLTWPNGLLFTEDTAYCTSVFNGKGLCMWGPHMIYSTAKNNSPKGVLLHSNVSDVALGRDNLESGKHYRVIMGMQPGDDASNKAIKLVYILYDLDNDCIVESQAINTYNFFADNWANDGQTRDEFCVGSIVAYGYFGTTTVLDKTYNIYEDTTIAAIGSALGMKTSSNATVSGDTITLGAGSIGAGANCRR